MAHCGLHWRWAVKNQRAREVVPALMSGELVLCWAFSEADATRPISTSAVREDGHWVISGTKHWVSRSAYADVVMVFARTGEATESREVTAFLLPTDIVALEPGASFGCDCTDGEVRTVGDELPDGWRGLDIGPLTVEAYAKQIAADVEKWRKVVAVTGAKAE